MSTTAHPVFLRMQGRRVLVVGGGVVATRRATALVRDGADVHVVSPDARPALRALADQGLLTWSQRPYRTGDVDGAWLVHTATGVPAVDEAVALEAEGNRVWCVRADDASASSAWTPAVAHGRDGLVLAVSGGGDPRRAVRVRDRLRRHLRGTGDAVGGEAPARPAIGPRPDRERLSRLPTAERGGHVALVGAGPGDPGLITVRGRDLLGRADVVVVDRLVPASLLDDLDPRVEVVHVGKEPARHPVPQRDIDALIVRHAQAGRRVVRLKGGDPFVLGRGGEEALACAAAGVRVEVVPGITSAVSVPAAAGIPVTHRGITSSFVVVSGHDRGGADRALAASDEASRDATLVVLMGVECLSTLTVGLVERGRSPATPVAIIESGWTPTQRTTVTTLGRAADDARAAGVTNPAVIVVGDVVALRTALGDLGVSGGEAGHVPKPTAERGVA